MDTTVNFASMITTEQTRHQRAGTLDPGRRPRAGWLAGGSAANCALPEHARLPGPPRLFRFQPRILTAAGQRRIHHPAAPDGAKISMKAYT